MSDFDLESYFDEFSLIDIADALDYAYRIGAEKDEPEGARYITISDTVATGFAKRLRKIANSI